MELRVNSAPERLGVRLREAREAVSLTQAELGDRLGVHARTIQYWESGKVPRPQHRRAALEFIEDVEGLRAA